MKTSLNQRIQFLSKSFHKGELSLADYRELRRKEFEVLNNASSDKVRKKSEGASIPIKQVFLATIVAVGLLCLTVIAAKILL